MANIKKNISRKIQQVKQISNKGNIGRDKFGNQVSYISKDNSSGCKQDVSCANGFVWVGDPFCRCMPEGFDLGRPPIDPVDNINISFGRPEDYIELHIYDRSNNAKTG